LPVPTRLALLDVLVGVFQPAGLLNERILHRIVALVLGAVSAGAWPMFVAANGAARGDDMRAYLCLADALWSLRVVTSARTRLPIFLVACRSVAATLGTDLAWVVAILQTLLLSGNAA